MATAADAVVPVVAARAMSADTEVTVRRVIRSLSACAVLVLAATPVIGNEPAMDECARDLLRTRLATAVEGKDVLAALAIESELLTLCNKRQELVAQVLENEERLAGLQPGEPVIDETVITAVFEAPEAPADDPEPPPDYGWFSILGTAGDLRAGITDGKDTWWVREGATLPGDIAIVAIHSRPPGVRVAGAANHALPWSPPPVLR